MRSLIAAKFLLLVTVLSVPSRGLAQAAPNGRTPAGAVEAAIKHILTPQYENLRVGLVPSALPDAVTQEVEKRTGWRIITSPRDEVVCESRGKCDFRTIDVLVEVVSVEAGEKGSVNVVANRTVVMRHREYGRMFYIRYLLTLELREGKWEVINEQLLEIS
ncbi:hypothetical protein HRbin33_02442 [bacterium HR33]|nr:hypothetical protein HRbin33_02442 [bacterium HR33]